MLSCHIGLLFGKRVDMILVDHWVKKYLGLLFTCYCTRCRFIFLHSAEQIQKYVDSLMNLPDACGQKAYPGRKCDRERQIDINGKPFERQKRRDDKRLSNSS